MAAKTQSTYSTSHLGFEARLWLSVDLSRNKQDPAEHKRVALGLISSREEQ